MDETRPGHRFITASLRTLEVNGAYVISAGRAFALAPVKTFQFPLLLGEFHNRICIVLWIVKIIDPVQLAIGQIGGHHCALHLVHRGKLPVLLQIEQRRSASQGVIPFQGGGSVKIRHHLGCLNLVIVYGVLLYYHKGVIHQVRLLQPLVCYEKRYAVRHVLVLAFLVPDYGSVIHTRY